METGTQPHPAAGQPADISVLLEHLFRHEAGRMVAILTRIFGLEHLALAEDVVQESLSRALQTWPFYGVPANPSAWLMRTARNLALDVVRREKVFREKQSQILQLMDRPNPVPDEEVFSPDEIADDGLRMMFVCCHPVIPPEAQLGLALNTLCGFSVAEISKAFLTSEAAIAKRLTRAKQKIREAGVRYEIPTGAELANRLGVVLEALYLLFNEGYKASSGQALVRKDLCEEAVRLTTLLAQHPIGNVPKTHALLALMLLNSARNDARVDSAGNLLRLQDQDRSLWDQGRMSRGMAHLAHSASGDEITRYHLEAGIAACHCAAPVYDSTDWARILALYDQLIVVDPSPVVALNRAVAVANVHGPLAGIEAVERISNRAQLDSYYLLYAVLGDFEARRQQFSAAAAFFRQALELTQLESERRFLTQRIQYCAEKKGTERQKHAA